MEVPFQTVTIQIADRYFEEENVPVDLPLPSATSFWMYPTVGVVLVCIYFLWK